jgi:transposase
VLRYYHHLQTCNRAFLRNHSTSKRDEQVRFIHDVSPETQRLLHRLYKESRYHRVRQRAHCILLSFQGLDTAALRAIFSVDRITLYNWFDAWEAHHFAGLYDKKRSGRPPTLTEEEQHKAQHYLEQHPRDVKKVVYLIEQETSKRVSTKTLKRLVKKTAMSGSGSKKRQRKVLIHTNTSGAKRSYSACSIKKLLGHASYGILMSVVFV